MNTQIAILIPTFQRPHKLRSLIDNIHTTTKTPHSIYFILESEDKISIETVKALNERYIINVAPHTYVQAINYGYRQTIEPYILCGADDIEFTPNWSELMLEKFKDPKIGFVGAKDDWAITKSGKHASHFMVSRKYIQEQSGVQDEANVIYSSQYFHYNCDIETEQVAMKRDTFIMSDAFIPHHHPFVDKRISSDATYDRARAGWRHDKDAYCSRRYSFEQYILQILPQKVVRVNHGTLSVIIASHNQKQYLKRTIESLLENTYHPFELIIVDNGSTDPATIEYINELHFPTTQKVTRLIKLRSDPNKFVTHTWNEGIKKAKGDYIAILNNDILLSQWWDAHLMNELLKEDGLLASPYQKDDVSQTAYDKCERTGNFDFRGACFMFKKDLIEQTGLFPEELKFWFSDTWLAWKVTKQLGKKSVFVPEAVIYHATSKSTDELEAKTNLVWWIVRGDAYAYHKMTGENVDHVLRLCEAKARRF